MNKLAVGILAHVDAGKTTLSECLLYLTGQIRRMGRVDHKDAYLDTFDLERERGITIFSKQATFFLGDKEEEREVTLLDTPGHVDFSAEMERTLQILDYAILVISGSDGVQGHTETLWRLLKRYHIPTFLFVNKMDQEGSVRKDILSELQKKLDSGCVPFDQAMTEGVTEEVMEEIAMTEETAMEYYLEHGTLAKEHITNLICTRHVFPVFFGSALRMDGVDTFIHGMEQYMKTPKYPKEFGAKIYKISRDEQGNRLSHAKITGGFLKVKSMLTDKAKVDQIRIYSGKKYEAVKEVTAGTVCALTGLEDTFAGQGFGIEEDFKDSVLEPVLTYGVILPEGTDVHKALLQFRQIEEEEPMLHVVWNGEAGEISVQLMGEVQTEILKSIFRERFELDVSFGEGEILYKETIEAPVLGVGHYEPLRHYAEVHLRLEPGEQGSGMTFDTICSEDVLDRNWQRLILTHLGEKEYRGVLGGFPITDMKITLTAGRAHLKHTEGGDFRQATYRAVRQGLKKAKSVLLEPWYEYKLEVPSGQVGRAMSDIQKMYGTFDGPEIDGDFSLLKGKAPAVCLLDYQKEVWAYTGGRGRLTLRLKGYEPCHNAEEVLETVHYDSERDLENPTGSVFCAHGAGFLVPWNQVEEYMHVEEKNNWREERAEREPETKNPASDSAGMSSWYDAELEAIMEREFGSKTEIADRYVEFSKTGSSAGKADTTYSGGKKVKTVKKSKEKTYLLVDGYNIIFSWEELRTLAQKNIDAARSKLMDIMCNLQGYWDNILILVFDAYKVKGNPGEVIKYHNIHVVYTKEAETADQYIEKTTHEIGRQYQVTVATSDVLEQVIVMGQGARKINADDFYEEVRFAEEEIRRIHKEKAQNRGNYLFDAADEKTAQMLEDVRLGKKKF